MKKAISLFVVFILLGTNLTFANERAKPLAPSAASADEPADSASSSTDLWSTVWNDHAKPTLLNGFDYSGLALIASGVAAVAVTQPHDKEIRHTHGLHRKMNKDTAEVGDILGSGAVGASIALTQLYFDKDNGYHHAESLVFTGLSTFLLKAINQRNRPNSHNKHSMPSGHTSTAFATATALTYSYGWWAAVPAYSLAVFTAYTRIADDAHWFSDTVGGAFVGIFWARASSLHHFNVTPVVTSETLGFHWSF
jgi:hypothetical protein